MPRSAPLADKPPIFGKLSRNLRLELLENPRKLKKDAPKISLDDPKASPVKPKSDNNDKSKHDSDDKSNHREDKHDSDDSRSKSKDDSRRHRSDETESDRDYHRSSQHVSSVMSSSKSSKVEDYSDTEKELLKQLADNNEEVLEFIDDSGSDKDRSRKKDKHKSKDITDDERYASDRSEVVFERERTDDEKDGYKSDASRRSDRKSSSKRRSDDDDSEYSDDEADKMKSKNEEADDGLPPKDPWENIEDPILREKTARKELMWRFYILKQGHPDKDIGGYDVMMDSEELKLIYEKKIKEIYIEQSIEDYTMYLFAGFIGIEYICTQYIGIDMRGFTKAQIYMMYKYHILLVELAEKNSHRFAGYGLPVEIRLAGLVLFSAAVFWLMKLCEKHLGADIASFLSGMLGQTKMKPREIIKNLETSLGKDGGKAEENTEEEEIPKVQKTTTGTGKKKMRGPTIDADNVRT